MKTKKAAKPYTCAECKRTIEKGEQYAKRSIRMGSSGMPDTTGMVRHWAPYRVTRPICLECSAK